jgi:hypothetical protein
MSNPLEDNSPALYMEAQAIAMRCRERLEVLDASDPVRFDIEVLLELAEAEAKKQASFLPY